MFSFCGATILNFILIEKDPNCSIDLFRKHIRQMFMLSSEDVLRKWHISLPPLWKLLFILYDMKTTDAYFIG